MQFSLLMKNKRGTTDGKTIEEVDASFLSEGMRVIVI